jgi:hypothetical protein
MVADAACLVRHYGQSRILSVFLSSLHSGERMGMGKFAASLAERKCVHFFAMQAADV